MLPLRARTASQLAVPVLCRRQWCGRRLLEPASRRQCHHRSASACTINFYRFRTPTCRVSEDKLRAHASAVESLCSAHGVVGTVILAAEGVNGSLAGGLEAVRNVVQAVSSAPPDQWPDAAPDLVHNEEVFVVPREAPFGKLKVKVKPEIVTMRLDKPLDMHCRGVEVSPEDWDDVVAAEDVLVLDTRNAFESDIGTFSGAVVPPLSKFSDFPRWAEAELVPHRGNSGEGGIRCEKASAYLLQHGGYKPGEVMQLKGGIQSYLSRRNAAPSQGEGKALGECQVPAAGESPVQMAASTWRGYCFVFDERTAVDGAGESITPAEAERLALKLGPRAGKSLRKRLAVAAGQTETVQTDSRGANTNKVE